MSSLDNDILLLQCQSLPEAQWIRGELISFNPRDYWFYVHNDNKITVANEFQGRISDEKFRVVKQEAERLKLVYQEKKK